MRSCNQDRPAAARRVRGARKSIWLHLLKFFITLNGNKRSYSVLSSVRLFFIVLQFSFAICCATNRAGECRIHSPTIYIYIVFQMHIRSTFECMDKKAAAHVLLCQPQSSAATAVANISIHDSFPSRRTVESNASLSDDMDRILSLQMPDSSLENTKEKKVTKKCKKKKIGASFGADIEFHSPVPICLQVYVGRIYFGILRNLANDILFMMLMHKINFPSYPISM